MEGVRMWQLIVIVAYVVGMLVLLACCYRDENRTGRKK